MEIALAGSKVTSRKRKTVQKSDDMEIMSTLGTIRTELENLQNSFDSVTEPELVDSYTYEILALKTKYCYYLNLCKQRGLAAAPDTKRALW